VISLHSQPFSSKSYQEGDEGDDEEEEEEDDLDTPAWYNKGQPQGSAGGENGAGITNEAAASKD
jgi:hypothetical protein